MTTAASRQVQRLRHEARRRLLTVKRVRHITPRMVCVTLSGDLQGFNSAAYDDHVKLFFPDAAGVIPESTPVSRDYTPRRYDAAANELDIEFVLHSEGPATAWAAQVQPGQTLGIGGPRGSFVLSGEFDWYLLVADEAGLPAVARRLAELPAPARAVVIAEVADAGEEQSFVSRAQVQTHWLHRNGHAPGSSDLLLNSLRQLILPAGEGYTWIASESHVARALRQYLVGERGFDKQWVKAAGYWKHGQAAAHEKHED